MSRSENRAMNSKLETIVNNMFKHSIDSQKDLKLCAGIAIECRRLDIVEEVCNKATNLSSVLDSIADSSSHMIQNRNFRDELLHLVLKMYVDKKIDSGKVDNINICMCYFRLGKFNETSDVLLRLISTDEVEDF